ncbi:FkbM family methyltransferase [Thermodesulfobacteriota bacterium]
MTEGIKFSLRLPEDRSIVISGPDRSSVPNYLFWRGYDGYEPDTMDVFLALIKDKEVFFDVGAHMGYYSLVAGCYNPKCEIYAFEPVEELYEQLRENIFLNRYSNITTVNCAATDSNGDITLYSSTEGDSSWSIVSGFRRSLGVRIVKGISLDSFAEENCIKAVDMIKLDVESAEPLVLKGMKRILKNDRPDIICEVLYGCTETDLMDLLADYDYSFYWLSPKGPIRKEYIVGDPNYRFQNYLFTPNKLPAMARKRKVISS